MANVISVTAFQTPTEGRLAASATRVISVSGILGIKAGTPISGVNSIISYSYNEDNALKSGDVWVSEAVAALVTAANA